MLSSDTATCVPVDDDDQYPEFLARVRSRFDWAAKQAPPLFTTAAEGLFTAFLDALPPAKRQHYTCNACRRFVERFGGLVTVELNGTTSSVLWDEEGVPFFFRTAVSALRRAVEKAAVTGIFLSKDTVWGTPLNRQRPAPGGGFDVITYWHHLAVTPSKALVHRPGPIQDTHEVVAEKLQDFHALTRSLEEFSPETVRQAHRLLTTGGLFRSEKCIGAAKWLMDLHEARDTTKNERARENLVWRAVATAPAGFCHVRSGMLGTLLEDVAAGMAFAQVKARFDAKMDPRFYQRPQAAPTAGNIAQAEEVIAKLNAAGSLARRFARLEDVLPHAAWSPKAPKEPSADTSGGVFAHLKPKAPSPALGFDLPQQTMTWVKFRRDVLPSAESIEMYVPSGHLSFFGLVTAANPDAPPILQWDREEKRNAVSWYTHQSGSLAAQWGLVSNTWYPVTAIVPQPTMWDPDRTYPHQGEKMFFLLKGARDMRYTQGAGFFPEQLRSEHHGVRATMEAYVREAVVAESEQASANGIAIQPGRPADVRLRVTSKTGRAVYLIDRWE